MNIPQKLIAAKLFLCLEYDSLIKQVVAWFETKIALKTTIFAVEKCAAPF